MNLRVQAFALICLSQFMFGCQKTATSPGPDIWDIKKEVKIHGILSLNEWGPILLTRPRSLSIKTSEDAIPMKGADEGCMCLYQIAPPSLGREVGRLLKTEEVFYDSLDDKNLSAARNEPMRPVLYLTYEQRQSYVAVDLLVKLGAKEAAHFEAKIRPSLAFNPQDFNTRAKRETVGFLRLLWEVALTAFAHPPPLEKSAVYQAVEAFLRDCAKPS